MYSWMPLEAVMNSSDTAFVHVKQYESFETMNDQEELKRTTTTVDGTKKLRSDPHKINTMADTKVDNSHFLP